MKTLTRTMLCLTVLALTWGTPFAVGQLLPDGDSNLASGGIDHNLSNNAALYTIYSNLGSKTDAYDDTVAASVCGPNSSDCGGEVWVAAPFRPKSNAEVTKIEVAFGYWGIAGGTNGNAMSINEDNHGLPGKALHSWVFNNLPAAYSCCTLQVGKFAQGKGVNVKKGTKYWVVAYTTKNEEAANDGWYNNYLDTVGPMAISQTGSSGWVLYTTYPSRALGVFGNKN